MKYFVAIFLFASFIAGLRADDLDGFLLDDEADGVDPTKHPYFQCKIDLYKCIKDGQKGKLECLKDYRSCMAVLIPTVPPFIIACKNDLKTCVSGASGIKEKAKCFKQFAICLKNKGPSDVVMDVAFDGEPDRHPYVQCKIDLYKCIKDGQKGKVECLKDYKSCMAVLIPTVPPFVIACKNDLKTCVSGASGLVAKAKCFKQFGICLKNKGPSDVVMDVAFDGEPDRHPYVQCKIDLYDCIKAGTPKLDCMKTYKSCMAVLLPTIPPHIIACKNELNTCLDKAWMIGKPQCYAEFAKCLVKPIPIPPIVQCNIDVAKCVKEGGKEKIVECAKGYKGCMMALIPTISPTVKQCFAPFEQCAYKAGGIFDLYRCMKAVVLCIKNGGPQ